ncbi:MAG: hypothetical protein AAB699_01620 [Patescibacteria group bacterium]
MIRMDTNKNIIPVCLILLFAVVFAASDAQAEGESRLVRAAYNEHGAFFLEDLPEDTKTAPAPACLSKEFIARYPDYPKRLSAEVSCANARMRASALEQKSALAEESLSVIALNKRLLEKTLAEIAGVSLLEGLREIGGVLMPRGVREERRGIEGAVFKPLCVLADAQASQGYPIGPRNSVFEAANVFRHSSAEIDRALMEDLPAFIDEYNTIEAEIKAVDAVPTKNPFAMAKRAVQKKAIEAQFLSFGPKVLKHAANYMVVGAASLVEELSLREKELLLRGASGLGQVASVSVLRTAGGCKGAGENSYTVSVGNKSFGGCFHDTKTVEMLREKTREKIVELEKERGKFETEKRNYESALASIKQANASCF